MYIKKYDEFIVEEISMKKIIAGGAILASTLGSCNTNTSSISTNNQSTEQSISSIELPKEFKMKEVFLTIGTDMNITSNGKKSEK